jgi:hypothetical protein
MAALLQLHVALKLRKTEFYSPGAAVEVNVALQRGLSI